MEDHTPAFSCYEQLSLRRRPHGNKIITIMHWLPVKAGKSGSMETVSGGNEATVTREPDFTVFTGSQRMIVFLAYHMHF